jgi:tRNA nucleotidyltransferase/poly(A) polymerase
MMNKKPFPALYDQIINLLEPYQAYLVGGAVRDMLLGKSIHDLDFTLPEDTIPAARMVADKLGGAFFILDPERETARVILKDEHSQRMMVDFTRFQGKDIKDDLASRDFTITSMALRTGSNRKVIDPFHGAQDLKDGLLRTTTGQALADDPLRCLRAVRLAVQFGLRILPETKDQIRQYAKGMAGISPERKRDELFRILDGPKQAAAIQSLEILGLSPYLFLGEVTDRQILQLRFLEDLWDLFLKKHDQDSAANWSLGLLVHRLGRYRTDLQSYLKFEQVLERTIYQHSFLALLLKYRLEENKINDFRLNLPLSNQEWDLLYRSTGAAEMILQYFKAVDSPQPLDIYRYYRQYKSAGILGVFLALAVKSSECRNSSDQEGWGRILDICRSFLEGWWEKKHQWVYPPILFDGNDIQTEFSISPGPQIGTLLESLREAQVERGISSREQAKQFLRDLLEDANEITE